GSPSRVGVELEWLAFDGPDRSRPAPFETMADVAGGLEPLPAGGRITFEPGGQLELSSAPWPDVATAIAATASDAAVLRDAMAEAGVELAGMGLDPLRPGRRVVDTPRYRAMDAYFDAERGTGLSM